MRTLAACIAAILVAGCAAAPRSDGGIIGSGNRIDCEDQANANKEECKLERGTRR